MNNWEHQFICTDFQVCHTYSGMPAPLQMCMCCKSCFLLIHVLFFGVFFPPKSRCASPVLHLPLNFFHRGILTNFTSRSWKSDLLLTSGSVFLFYSPCVSSPWKHTCVLEPFLAWDHAISVSFKGFKELFLNYFRLSETKVGITVSVQHAFFFPPGVFSPCAWSFCSSHSTNSTPSRLWYLTLDLNILYIHSQFVWN